MFVILPTSKMELFAKIVKIVIRFTDRFACFTLYDLLGTWNLRFSLTVYTSIELDGNLLLISLLFDLILILRIVEPCFSKYIQS